MHEEMQDPSEEELRAAFEEQLRQIRVEDVILQTVATLVNLGARRLGLEASEERDLGQAQLAIEAARALAPLCPEDQQQPIRQALSQVQMAFAREAKTGEAPPAEKPATAADQAGAEDEPAAKQDDEAEAARARARAKIWTPPGA